LTCKSCEQFREERIAIYMRKFNLSREEAESRFKKIKSLIDKAIEKRKPSKVRFQEFRRWVFQTNWQATFLWSFLKHKIVWIGKGFNPDYTQPCNACIVGGNCAAGDECAVPANCRVSNTCTPNCPAPLPNSTCTPNTCACSKGGCSCVGTPKLCAGVASCAAPVGQCNCNCNTGFHWETNQCVPNPEAKAGLHPSKPLAIILNE